MKVDPRVLETLLRFIRYYHEDIGELPDAETYEVMKRRAIEDTPCFTYGVNRTPRGAFKRG